MKNIKLTKEETTRLLWLDFEFTGKDINNDKIRECAVIFEKQNQESYIKRWKIGYSESLFPSQITLNELNSKLSVIIYILTNKNVLTPVIFAGYNIRYDLKWLKRHVFAEFDPIWRFISPQVFDVLEFVRFANLPTKNNKLETVARYFSIPHTPHNALSDIRATRFVYDKLKGGLNGNNM